MQSIRLPDFGLSLLETYAKVNLIVCVVSLDEVDPHNVTGSGTIISRCDFFLWRKHVTVGLPFEVPYAQDTARCLSPFPVGCKM